MENNTSTIFLRCPEQLFIWLQSEAKEKGFRSTQEYVLQILRERKEQETVEFAAEKIAA